MNSCSDELLYICQICVKFGCLIDVYSYLFIHNTRECYLFGSFHRLRFIHNLENNGHLFEMFKTLYTRVDLRRP